MKFSPNSNNASAGSLNKIPGLKENLKNDKKNYNTNYFSKNNNESSLEEKVLNEPSNDSFNKKSKYTNIPGDILKKGDFLENNKDKNTLNINDDEEKLSPKNLKIKGKKRFKKFFRKKKIGGERDFSKDDNESSILNFDFNENYLNKYKQSDFLGKKKELKDDLEILSNKYAKKSNDFYSKLKLLEKNCYNNKGSKKKINCR